MTYILLYHYRILPEWEVIVFMITFICNFCTYFICDNKRFWNDKYVRPVYNQPYLLLTHTLLSLHIKISVVSSAPLCCKPRVFVYTKENLNYIYEVVDDISICILVHVYSVYSFLIVFYCSQGIAIDSLCQNIIA